MKIYFRIFSYTSNKGLALTRFLIFAILGVVFSAVNLTLAIPLLDVLFNQTKTMVIPPSPVFEPSIDYLLALFNHHFVNVIVTYGNLSALLFVCMMLISTAVITNIFRYLERIVATQVKVDVVKHLRMHIFESVTRLHIGYFNDQRKGDLISRFTNDVAEVENSVLNLLKSVIKEPIAIITYIAVLFLSLPSSRCWRWWRCPSLAGSSPISSGCCGSPRGPARSRSGAW